MASCQSRDNPNTRLSFDFLDSLKKFTGDTLTFKLTKEEVDNQDFRLVDSVFYQTYLTNEKNFKGFNFSFSDKGGPTCYQYYYGTIGGRIPEYRQLLILQSYTFNDQVNDLFLLTFDNRDSLVSTLQVASLIFQSEIEPVFSSKMYPDNRVIKSEVTINHLPDNLKLHILDDGSRSYEPDSSLLRFCTDSLTKQFRFVKGKFILDKKDSVTNCIWKNIE